MYLDIYSKCFTNETWLKRYGLNPASFDFREYLRNAVLTEYPSVERLIVTNKDSVPLLFAHANYHADNCIVLGGVTPGLINSGKGVYCSQIVFDYLFKMRNVRQISVSVLASNINSLKMVKRMGFKKKRFYLRKWVRQLFFS